MTAAEQRPLTMAGLQTVVAALTAGVVILLADFSSLTIVQCAIIEGAALLGLTIYLVADLGVGLVVGLLGLFGLAFLFPTRSRLETFRLLVTRPE